LAGSDLLLPIFGFAPALVEMLFTIAEFRAAMGSFGAGAAFGGGGGAFAMGTGLDVDEAAE